MQDWTAGITDVTGLAGEIHGLVTDGRLTEARERLPAERPYPIPGSLKAVIGASEADDAVQETWLRSAACPTWPTCAPGSPPSSDAWR